MYGKYKRKHKRKHKIPTLRDYMYFVDLVRKYHEKNEFKNLRGAIECAIDQCIAENVLKQFLIEHRSEVVKMMQLDYTFERQLELEREEGRVEGREEGRAEGFEEGRTEGREEGQQILADVLMRLQKGETAEELMAAGIDEKNIAAGIGDPSSEKSTKSLTYTSCDVIITSKQSFRLMLQPGNFP